MAVLHRLDITAEFLIEVIRKDEFSAYIEKLRAPFVPPGESDYLRVGVECGLPLLIPEPSALSSVRGFRVRHIR